MMLSKLTSFFSEIKFSYIRIQNILVACYDYYIDEDSKASENKDEFTNIELHVTI